jgi:predicted nucleic acid-binding protein
VVARLLKACTVEPLTGAVARAAGALRRATGRAGTVDACVAIGVRRRGDALATSDPEDMRTLLGPRATILAV